MTSGKGECYLKPIEMYEMHGEKKMPANDTAHRRREDIEKMAAR